MAIDFDTDLEEMLSSDDHGVSVVYSAATFSGILNNEYAEEEGSGLNSISTSEPIVAVQTTNVAALAQDDAITVDSINYTVGDFEPDGTGLTLIRLVLVP